MLKALRSVVRLRRFERNGALRRLERSSNLEDLRLLAKKRLPGGVFDYIDGAAEDERTAVRNMQGFEAITFKPRVLRGIESIDTSTELLGKRLPLPLVLAPTGFTRMANSAGELSVARAAERAGLPYGLSTLSTRSIEEVAAVSSGERWFQVYVWRDRDLVDEMLERAAACNYSTIILTVDNTVLGRRERDVRRGFTLPPKIGLDTIFDGLRHPSWTWDFITSEPIKFANLTESTVGDGSDPVSLATYINTQLDPSLSWEDLAWLRDRWKGKLVIKGIQSVNDALLSVDYGVDAVALSNHGGRQLDDAPAPIDLLPEVVAALGGQTEIIVDGGVRRGSDIVKAVALGANACMVGRPYLYGLGAAGEVGVDFVIDHFATGLERTLALLGCPSVDELGPQYLSVNKH